MTTFDCQSCGACCCNARANEAVGRVDYVEIDDPKSALLRRDDLRKRYVAVNDEGVPHLRLDPSGRCAALKGRLGERVACQVYTHRPAPCRRVTAGDRECLRARRERGLD